MRPLYSEFLKIIERWPLDKNKQQRDIAEHLRALLPQLKESYKTATTEQSDYFTKQNNALNRLSKNIYFSKYKRMHNSTATGLSAKQCSQVLSSEFLQYLKDTNH